MSGGGGGVVSLRSPWWLAPICLTRRLTKHREIPSESPGFFRKMVEINVLESIFFDGSIDLIALHNFSRTFSGEHSRKTEKFPQSLKFMLENVEFFMFRDFHYYGIYTVNVMIHTARFRRVLSSVGWRSWMAGEPHQVVIMDICWRVTRRLRLSQIRVYQVWVEDWQSWCGWSHDVNPNLNFSKLVLNAQPA